MALRPTSAALAALLMTAAPGMVLAQTADTATDAATAPSDASSSTSTPAPAADTASDAAPAATAAPEAAATGTEPDSAEATTPSANAATPTPGTDVAAPSDTVPADTTAADPAPADQPAGTATADAPAADAPAAAGTTQPAPSTAGQPAATREEAQVGGYFVESVNGEWTLRCLKAPEGPDPCELYQLMQDDKGNPVAEISLIPLAGEAVAGATIVAPLETDLVAGLGLKVDAGKQMAYPFGFCAPIGCVARVGFSQAEVDAMKRGNKATVSLLPYGAEPSAKVDLDLSLTGFTAGYDALKAKGPANPSQQ